MIAYCVISYLFEFGTSIVPIDVIVKKIPYVKID